MRVERRRTKDWRLTILELRKREYLIAKRPLRR